MPTSASVLKFLRLTHRYIGVFCAPAILFFSFTGAVQTFSLHETTQGSSYRPPAILVKLGQLHKKATLEVPVRKPKPAAPPDAAKKDKAADAVAAPTAPAPKPKGHLPMKMFFLVVAVGLFVSTLTGIYMSYRYGGSKVVVTVLLVAGIVVPLVLLPF
jgi:hypothetical protein